MLQTFATMIDKIAPDIFDRGMWRGLATAPRRRIAWAIAYGVVCHVAFAIGVGAMIAAMFFGMSRSLGTVPGAGAWLANALLLAQFPLGHSLLLTQGGRRVLTRLGPPGLGADLVSTTYAAIASLQVFALFALWTPSGITWWEASDAVFWVLCALYAAAWIVLMKAMLDAGLALQSGLLGWWAVLRGARPMYPDMPTRGLFRLTRQPIYVAFAATLWTVPVWTPDQLVLASVLTGYCLAGPLLKERRFARLFGARFEAYRNATPYWLPIPKRRAE